MKLNPELTYVVLDLEETMFYQAVHLTNTFGADRVVLCDPGTVPASLDKGKFYLMAQARPEAVKSLRFDLAINQQSMQEMSTPQVEHYCDILAATAERFYSINLPQHGQGVQEDKQIVKDLDGLLIKRFGGAVWDSYRPMRWLKSLMRRPALKAMTMGARILASQSNALAGLYRAIFRRPLWRSSEARLRRLLLNCRKD